MNAPHVPLKGVSALASEADWTQAAEAAIPSFHSLPVSNRCEAQTHTHELGAVAPGVTVGAVSEALGGVLGVGRPEGLTGVVGCGADAARARSHQGPALVDGGDRGGVVLTQDEQDEPVIGGMRRKGRRKRGSSGRRTRSLRLYG